MKNMDSLQTLEKLRFKYSQLCTVKCHQFCSYATRLEVMKIFKYLGFQTDCLFSSDAHFKYVLSEFRKAVFLYRRVLCTKNDELLVKLLKTYTLPKLYGLEMVDPSISKRYEERYHYIISITLQRSTKSIPEFLEHNAELKLENVIRKANERKP